MLDCADFRRADFSEGVIDSSVAPSARVGKELDKRLTTVGGVLSPCL